MITNYAIIDHAGSVANAKALYKTAFATAKEKFAEAVTLKKVCRDANDYFEFMTEEQQRKMKFAMRYNRKPARVYIVCHAQSEPVAKFIASIWEDRDIPVTFIEEQPAPARTIETVSRARRCASIWGAALGWSFSAPLFRDPHTESIDMYTARQNIDAETGSYAAKRTTTPEKYVQAFRAVASERECNEFFQHYAYLQKNGLLAEFLEPDWHICPTCGRPVRESADECQWCSTKFESVLLEPFWEDSYQEDEIAC